MPNGQEIAAISTQIKELTNDLAGLELDGIERGNHKWASIKPQRNKVKNQHQYLDALARLVTSAREPCLAVFYDRGELLVASNYEEPRYAKHYLTRLGEFITTPSWGNYEKLVLLTSGQIKFLIKNESMDEELEQPKRKKKETKKLALEQFKNYLLAEKSLTANQIQKLAEKALEELLNPENIAYSETERHDNWEKYLLPLEDTNTITNAIITKRLDSKIIRVISEKVIDYIPGKKEVHAEMKIIGRLHETGRLRKTGGYIGITKLCCVPCQITLDVLNRGRLSFCATELSPLFADFFSKLSLVPFQVRGTHGGTYKNWAVPDIPDVYKYRLLEKLRSLCPARKIRETASAIPQQLVLSILWEQHDSSLVALPEIGSSALLITETEEEIEVSDIFLEEGTSDNWQAEIQVESKNF